ncbi:hypothetical protein [Burkholderia perseverans]|uniref:hypothetical protein n=1 Tax=Burkholderia perseverans TaxID=2615214 RepID=UPI001FEDC6A7|nr:hypothetical protein [Burkholderia perseverans]
MHEISEFIAPCLVPFEVYRRPDGAVVYANERLAMSERELLDAFSCSTDRYADDGGGEAGRTLFAERYGGAGVSVNGGGGRCGFDGKQFQVKGVGRNPLVGGAPGSAHSDGILPMSFALYEMIWSRILRDKLPFGVVDCQAVIAIASSRPAGAPDRFERALLVREVCLRPAHFERAAYFRRDEVNVTADRDADVDRVSRMQRGIEPILQHLFALDTPSSESTTLAGLGEFARRQAHQLAFARANFLLHSVSSSNFSMDGRWLDLTSIASLHPQQAFTADTIGSAWSRLWEHEFIIWEIVGSVMFHYAKYRRRSDAFLADALASLRETFFSALDEAGAQYFLCTIGVPMIVARRIAGTRAVREWARCYAQTLKSDFANAGANRRRMTGPEATHGAGFSFLPLSAFAALARDRHAAAPEREVTAGYARCLDEVMVEVRRGAADLGIDPRALEAALAINAVKYSTEKAGLGFDELRGGLSSLIETDSGDVAAMRARIAGHVDRLVEIGAFRIGFDPGMALGCWREAGVAIDYDMHGDRFVVHDRGRRETVERACWKPGAEGRPAWRAMIDFYERHDAHLIFQ